MTDPATGTTDGVLRITLALVWDRGLVETTLPSGTVTFLITDIEGSTTLWEEHGEDMRTALTHHDRRLRAVIAGRGGVVFKHTGDGLCSAFGDAGSAVLAAVEAQQALDDQDWGPVGDLRVRIGLHTGEAEPDGRDYHAPAVNRAARIEDAATGGQILVSDATRALADDVLDGGIDAVDLGEHELRGLARPVRLHQVLHPDLDTALPPLRAAPRLLGNLPEKAGELIGQRRRPHRDPGGGHDRLGPHPHGRRWRGQDLPRARSRPAPRLPVRSRRVDGGAGAAHRPRRRHRQRPGRPRDQEGTGHRPAHQPPRRPAVARPPRRPRQLRTRLGHRGRPGRCHPLGLPRRGTDRHQP